MVQPGAILSVRIPDDDISLILTFFQDGAVLLLQAVLFSSFWLWLAGKLMHPQEGGAFTSVFAGCAPRDDLNISHGAYLVPPNVIEEQSRAALDIGKQDELFKFTVKLLDESGVQVQGLSTTNGHT